MPPWRARATVLPALPGLRLSLLVLSPLCLAASFLPALTTLPGQLGALRVPSALMLLRCCSLRTCGHSTSRARFSFFSEFLGAACKCPNAPYVFSSIPTFIRGLATSGS